MSVECPVCRRRIAASGGTGHVRRHHDTAGNNCPMGGRRVPIEYVEDARGL